MKRINIKTTLIFWDIITFIVIFISTYLMFEVVIKNIISNSSNRDFYEKLDSIETEYFNAFDYLEKKDTLIYFDYVDEILNYSISSGINKIKYDDSLFIILTDIQGLEILSGKKNDPNYSLNINEELLKKLHYDASHIPKTISNENYITLLHKCNNSEEENYIKNLFLENDTNSFYLSRVPTIEDRNIFNLISKGSEYTSDDTVSFKFKFNKKDYIGIVEYAKHGINISADERTYPIFIIADLSSDFYYLINKVRNTFLLILGLVFILVIIIKIITTTKITREIAVISQKIAQESENIRTNGFVSKKVNAVSTGFIETSLLFDSYSNLHHQLNVLGEIVSGISDKELLSAVLMDATSILDPHEEEMTVLFLDIKGFTTLTEKYQEKVFTIVNSIWIEVEKIIEVNHGKINKYIGDACLIIFQEGKGSQNSSFYALKSAILILEKVRYLEKVLKIDFNFRVGLDHGLVVYGKTGTDKNYELGVIGDTVNTSARLESINKQYKTNLLMTESVVERTKNHLKVLNPQLSFYKVDKVRPKGKKNPKELFTILANNGKHSRFLGADDYITNSSLKYIQNLMESFTESVSLWNAGSDNKLAYKMWIDTLNNIKAAYKKEAIPTMEKYISRIVTVTEFEEYKIDKDSWFDKNHHEIQEPSDDWIKYGYIEIEK